MTDLPEKAVILARGLGTRMRLDSAEIALDSVQKNIADQGLKTLLPLFDGKCLLDFIFESLKASGFTKICLVIGTEQQPLIDFCRQKSDEISFVFQEKPLGTADAVLSAEEFVGNDLFLSVNSDNLYPVNVLRQMRLENQSCLAAFESRSLAAKSNISAERIAKFAVVETDSEGFLKSIVEKPEKVSPDALVSMNAWIFSPGIFRACRSIKPSVRGELEITDAVMFAVKNSGEKFKAVRTNEGVLDLSNRADIRQVAERLKG